MSVLYIARASGLPWRCGGDKGECEDNKSGVLHVPRRGRIMLATGSIFASIQAASASCMHGCLLQLYSKAPKSVTRPCDMMRRAAGCARPPNPEARARAPEPGKGQARLARAARRSESTSETRSGMRAHARQQKWLDGLYEPDSGRAGRAMDLTHPRLSSLYM